MTTPNGSGIINRGTDYEDGSQVTSGNLNEHVDNAVFNDDAVDDVTIGLNSDTPKALFVKNSGIDTAQIADDAITFVKLADATLTSIKEAIKEDLYPTGSLLTTTVNYADSAAVVAAYGGTTWERFGEGQVLVGHSTTDSDFNAATPTTGGVKEVTLTKEQSGLPAHTHYLQYYSFSDSGDNGGAATGDDSRANTGNSQNLGTIAIDGADASQAHTNLQPYITVYMWKRTV